MEILNVWRSADRGNGLVFCDHDCSEAYKARATKQDGTYGLLPDVKMRACAHCAWCGARAYQPTVCVLHGHTCPPTAPEQTLVATLITSALQTLTGRPFITDEQWEWVTRSIARYPDPLTGPDELTWLLEHQTDWA